MIKRGLMFVIFAVVFVLPIVASTTTDIIVKTAPNHDVMFSFYGPNGGDLINRTKSVSSIDETASAVFRGDMDSVDIIFVAYGHGKQEKWIVRNNKAINAKVCIGVGGSFDVISGLKKRAPLLVRKVKLEWFYRLLQEPRRVRRILTSVFIFPIYIFLYSLKHK